MNKFEGVPMIAHCTSLAYQKGAVLVVSLIILALMTLIGVTAIQVTTQQEKMVSNTRDLNTAFQAAEAALIQAEQVISNIDMGTIVFTPGCANGFCQPVCSTAYMVPDCVATLVAQWDAVNWQSATTPPPQIYTYNGVNPSIAALPDVALQPRYIIEDITSTVGGGRGVASSGFYRVTAQGYGSAVNDNGVPLARVMLQSIYKK